VERPVLRIGTRGSALALVQAHMVRDALQAAGVEAPLVVITTEGDQRAADTAWGEGAFVGAIESALLDGTIDVAVHSAKDVPTDEDPRLTITAFLPRAVPTDVIVMPAGKRATGLDELPIGARVGTDSPRRTAFLRAVRPDLEMHPLHGNVDTRLRRLDEGQSDALVLAEAGLTRLGRADRISFRLPADVVPPAPGQGAVAIQVRAADAPAIELIGRLDDPATRTAVEAERALLAASGGGCRAPLGALARVVDAEAGEIELLGGFARADGRVRAIARRRGLPGDARLVSGVLDDLAAAAAEAALELPIPRVIVARSAEQSAALQLALVDRGLAPISVPAIAIQPAGDGLAETAARLDTFDWVVVTSANAARALAAALPGGSPASGGPRFAAVGLATSQALRGAGIPVALRPERSSGAALADALPLEPGERVLLPRSDIADPALVARLEARGAVVDNVVAYRTVEAPEASVPKLRRALSESPVAVVLTSGSTARGIVTLAERLGAGASMTFIPAICIGPGTAAEATALGFRVAAEARSQNVADIADAVAAALLTSEESR
jgi:hydroxymethylbilane synthase